MQVGIIDAKDNRSHGEGTEKKPHDPSNVTVTLSGRTERIIRYIIVKGFEKKPNVGE